MRGLYLLQLQCCGLSVQESDAPWLIWRKNMLLNSGAADSRVPDSCCRVDAVSGAVEQCVSPKGDVDDTRLYRRDCYDAGTEFLGRHALVIASVALAGAAVLVRRLLLHNRELEMCVPVTDRFSLFLSDVRYGVLDISIQADRMTGSIFKSKARHQM